MNISAYFRPKLVDTLRGYTRADFGSDLVAGLTVAGASGANGAV